MTSVSETDSRIEKLVAELREDAAEVKECFTRFTFQASALATAILGGVVAAMEKHPYSALAVIPTIYFLMVVCRIGIHKYATANRNYGYELHLARTESITQDHQATKRASWSREMRSIRWEEALRAWRIVQPTIFRHLYHTPENTPMRAVWMLPPLRTVVDLFRPKLYTPKAEVRVVVRKYQRYRRNDTDPAPKRYPWFMLDKMIVANGEPVVYYAGSYLRQMFRLLETLQLMLLLPLVVVGVQRWADPAYTLGPISLGKACVLLSVLGCIAIFLRYLRVQNRREILESQLLCVHSTAILWQAITLAHYRALYRGTSTGYSKGYYTERLVKEAEHLRHHIYSIHRWVDGRYFTPTGNLRRVLRFDRQA